ncbi:uncharacterized protein LOC126683104 [Mercurialis annua]|uniref:uncharacterized protein LOC126683104 n=1 Tax=Mercurialis annua TaxID=3986 RepID=UPI00215E93AC|nr:uncharacterized protein LOC126683104 [Mercurialis annua]
MPSKKPLPVKFLIHVDRRCMQKKRLMLPFFTRSFRKEFRSCKFATLGFPNGFSVRVGLSNMKNRKARIDIAKLVELGYIHKGFIMGFTYKGVSFFKVAVFDPSQAFLQIEYPCNVTKFSKQHFSHKQTRFCNNEETDDDQETTSDDDDDDQETSDGDDDDEDRKGFLKKKNKFKSSVGQRTNKDGKRVATRDDYRSPNIMKSNRKKATTKNGSNDDDQEFTSDDDDDQEPIGGDEDRKKSSKRKNKFRSYMNQRTKKHGKRVAAGDDYVKCKRKKSIGMEKKCKIEKEETDSDENESSACEKEAELIVSKNFESIYLNLSPESKRAVDAAKRYKRTSPAFMTVIRTLQNKCSLYIPAEFYNKYMYKISRDNVRIQTSDGKGGRKEWLVRICRREQGIIFTQGLGRFSKDNGLSVGDACVFELIDSKNFVFKASIFDA